MLFPALVRELDLLVKGKKKNRIGSVGSSSGQKGSGTESSGESNHS
jgi:hypothetical protein